ncbi:MAG: hypothetical protein P4M09_09140 [Devosia sp.]|nr:hypothetical protein [Devosia sp.]
MAERKSGPVKPPVIDLTARVAEPDKPAPSTKPASDAKPALDARPAATANPAAPPAAAKSKPEAPQQSAPEPAAAAKRPPEGTPWAPALLGAFGGAVIAIAACYGLAGAGLWPSAAGDTEARLGQLQSGLQQSQSTAAATTAALADVNTRLGGLESDFAAKLAAASATLTQMQQTVGKLESARPQAVDLGPLAAEMKTLAARVDAVAAGASSADAGAIAANLATLQQNVAQLGDRITTLDTRAGATDTAVASLRTELASAKSAIDQAAGAPSAKAIASAMQLPLLISALEADFTAGRPYAADLARLKDAVPEAHIPAAVTDFAAAGLPAPEALTHDFETAMPDILAARPAATDSSWQGQATDWLQRVLALRPQGQLTGDSPDALLSQLEAAVVRHDFGGASKLLDRLPPGMQQAAGELAAKIRALADAESFVSGLRSAALAPAAGRQP